ncbi:MAG: ABC transporter substrate-binding protein [Flavobacteriia bacterium]|nr:ABC transporter substrate-binding protein [Flavobacteriia bacterium]
MKEYKDQMNHTIRLSAPPRRIVSLVPSQTELLYDLGLEEEVVGITKFCIHPKEWFRTKNRVGGTKNISLEKVLSLQPDLLIGNKEENEKENIENLKSHVPTWMSDICSLSDAIEMIEKVGELVGKTVKALEISAQIKDSFAQFKSENFERFSGESPSVLYLIWRNPYLSAGKNTFIDSILSECGFSNFTHEDRYPEIVMNSKKSPNYIFLSSEPYPFKEKHIDELNLIYPKSKIILVDGEMFSWYGSRLLKATAYFKEIYLELN